jgi:uncharacterized protein (TIGR04255 family)
MTAKPLPSYENPPVNEVVCGILFQPLNKFLLPHFGQLWERFKPDYPACQEASPLAPSIEHFEDSESPTEVGLPAPPFLPRVWFVHKNGTGVIQVQKDRFLHNWRKTKPEDQYPRYHNVKELFQRHLATFSSFLKEFELGHLVPRQYEMTYINHVPQGEGWDTIKDFAHVFPDFAWRVSDDRFLPEPEGRNLLMTFLLPDNSGRLHMAIRTAVRRADARPVLMLELTARGMATDVSPEAMWLWFDTAREWIVRGFADLTGDNVQHEVWRRTT